MNTAMAEFAVSNSNQDEKGEAYVCVAYPVAAGATQITVNEFDEDGDIECVVFDEDNTEALVRLINTSVDNQNLVDKNKTETEVLDIIHTSDINQNLICLETEVLNISMELAASNSIEDK